jgi:hypothetical protein
MSSIKFIDMLLIDDLFDMHGGYVLDFSDRTFAEFFARELNIDIDDSLYRKDGTSKAKRLRCFLQTVDNPTTVCVLNALWEYREAIRARTGQEEKITNAHARLLDLIRRLEGRASPTSPSQRPSKLTANSTLLHQLGLDLVALSKLEPHSRGYAFEKFLKELFDAYGLEAREAFRLRGEQIDGSFQLTNETYLLEAKWQSAPTGAEDLHAFNGKVENKAAWARGLFISQSGFSEDGLHAFGRGKRLICMDGLDLYETLSRNLSLGEVLALKVRRAAETGVPFIRVRDLYPS